MPDSASKIPPGSNGRCDTELLKTLVKNPSDVLAATPDGIQSPLLEGFGPGLIRATGGKEHIQYLICCREILCSKG